VREAAATALYAGLRRGEARGLRWSDVDLKAREIHVRRSWDDAEGAITPKRKAGTRTVPILGPLAPLLAELKLKTGDGADLVFGVTAEKPFAPPSVLRRAGQA
jgi:integrase